MAQTILLKRSAVQGNIPTTATLALGEIGMNTYDGKLFMRKDNGSPSILDLTAASNLSVVAAGNITTLNVQAALQELDTKKQATLVSGTNLKTINSQSLLGLGDIVISGTVTLTDDTTTNATYYPVFATAATGAMTGKASSTKLSFNPSTGVLFATGMTTTTPASTDNSTNVATTAFVQLLEDGLQTAKASATTTTIGTAGSGETVHITGTTSITSLGVSVTGVVRNVIFDGILTLTYNATSLILPGAVNKTTAAGDTATFVCENGASGYWRCLDYSPFTITTGGSSVPVGPGTDKVFYENDNTINTSYTLTANKNMVSAGPITVAAAAIVTIPSTTSWTIV